MTSVLTSRSRPLVTVIRSARENPDQYKSSVMELQTYAGRVYAYQLPGLKNPDQWPGGAKAYQAATDCWASLAGNMRGWAAVTLTDLVALPVTIEGTSKVSVMPYLAGAISDASYLVQHPNDPLARDALMLKVGRLQNEFGLVSSQTLALIGSLEGQAATFDDNAHTMGVIADNAQKTVGSNKKLIEEFNHQIDVLNNDIKAQALAIAGGSVVTILGLIMGGIGIFLAPFTGGVSLFLLVPAAVIVAGGVLIITLAAKKIEQDKQAIESLRNQITGLNGDITLLTTMASTLTGFSGQVGSMKSAVSAVAEPWHQAAKYFGDTLTILNGIQAPSTSDWEHVLAEMTEIRGEWADLMAKMPGLCFDSKVAPAARLDLGMDQNQVQNAINQSGTVSLRSYLAA